jgi:hypothetical protein
MSLSQTHIDKINGLRTKTYAHVIIYMPEWRQVKWNNFISYYSIPEKERLPFQRNIIKTMINEGQTEEDAYNVAIAGLTWLSECIMMHDDFEKYIRRLPESVVTDIDINDLIYPDWPFIHNDF